MPTGVYERVPGRRKPHTAEARARMAAAMRGKGVGNRNAWKGGRTELNGYVLVSVSPDHPMADQQGRVYEHRLVMADHVGRPLRSDEVVHHVNGVKHDNRLGNLVLCTGQREHMAHHKKER